mgnify:CR=1 FL=1
MKHNLLLRRAISTLAVTALTVFAPISAVSAHTELVSTSPEADSEVNVAGEIISLTFGEPPLADGAAIVIVNESGETLMTPTPTLEGATLSIPWPMDLSPGKVTVQWRASADDGHVLNGEYTFPVPGSGVDKTLRLFGFVDAGNVFDGTIELSQLRKSYGFGLSWISPLGPLKFSYALPLNSKPEDRLQRFQFQIGTAF